MKNILSILFILLLSVTVFAQNPKLSYQSVVRDSENKLVVEQPITVTMNVLDAAGNSQFEQTLNATTNRNGLVSLEFGDETAAWSNIDWNGAKIRTAVAYDGNEMVDTAVVNSVPFALYANTVNTAAIPQSDWAETDNTKCTFILNKPSIADTVNNILTAGNYVTTATMDARGYLTSDSAVITTMLTNIASNTTNITANTNAIESLANRVNTFNTNVCDSVTTCINNAIDARGYLTSDSAVITTMQTSIASNTARIAANADKIAANASDITTNANAIESLANRVNTFNTNVCDSVTTCINNAIDARGYLTSDSAVITTMQTNIANNTTNIATNAGNIAANASNITTNANAIAAAVTKEKADSTTLAGRITALESATMNCNDVKACIADTLSKYTTTDQLCNVVSTCDFSTNASLQNMLNELSSKLSATQTKLDSLSNSIDSIADIEPIHEMSSVTTDSVNDITSDLATLYGNVTDLGGNASVNAGFKYGTSETAMNTKVDNPVSATGLYSINITGLAGTTTYYFKAYAATNATDTAWGEVKSFITLPEPIAAADEMSVTTDSVNDITSDLATLYGNVTDLGGNASVNAGFKYGTSETAMNTKVDNPVSATGLYSINITGLAGTTTYYFKAYAATNATDTVWGEVKSFITLPEPIAAADEMSVTTDSASTVTSSASTLYGNVKRLGDNASVTVGFKYGKCTCSMDSVKNISVNTTGSYHVALNNLAPATTYSYAAFITTGVNDTVWGDTLSFTTPSANPCSGQAVVTDHEGNEYPTVQIDGQCWMAQNLRVATSPVSGHTLTESTDTSTLASYYSQNSKYCGEGYLYNWRAAMDLTAPAKNYTSEQSNYRGLCPEGWHIPTDSEWSTFATLFANYETVRPNFALTPAGYRAYDKDLHTSAIVFDEGFEGNEDGYSFFWSATPEADHSQTHVYNRYTSDDEILHQGGYKKEYQLSIRCLRNVVGD